MTQLLPLISQGAWLGFTIAAGLLAYLVAVPLFANWERKGIGTGEPYTKYLRTWTRKHPWFAVFWYLSMAIIIIGGIWLVYHVGPECLVKPNGIGCDA